MKYKLLYVDDEPSNLRIFKDTFRREFDVFIADSAKQGLEALKSNKMDVVLSDQRMPEMTGVEFLKCVLNKHPKSIRILVTAYTDYDAIKNAINQAHIFHYIQKPWDELELKRLIDHTMQINLLKEENLRQKRELINTALQISKTGKIVSHALEQINDLLKEYGDEEVCKDLYHIKRKLEFQMRKDDNWELFKLRFKEVHTEFFENIKEAHPNISKAELRYCSYLYLNMHTDQIASALIVSKDAIRKTRYRIRKKFGLHPNELLEEYIYKF